MIIYMILLCALALITLLYQGYCYAQYKVSKTDLTEVKTGCECHSHETLNLSKCPADLLVYGTV